MKIIKKTFALFLLLVMISGVLAGCHADTDKPLDSSKDFTQAKIGILTGSSFDLLAKEYFP